MFSESKYTLKEMLFNCENLIKLTKDNFEEVKKFSEGAASNFRIENGVACCCIDLQGYLCTLSEKDILGITKKDGLIVFCNDNQSKEE